MNKLFIRVGAISGGLSVALGAFGAHALKTIVPEEAQHTFHTGVEYQFYHSLALLIVGLLWGANPSKSLKWAGNLFIGGIIFFSGSLYILTLMKATGEVGIRSFGLITPIGGLLFMGGWLSLALGIPRTIHKHVDKGL